MLLVMNATAQASALTTTGPKLDNRRVMAALVDLAIVVAGSLVILFAADALSGDRGGALVAVILGWSLYYYFALESGDGQTVGKKLLKLRVVLADGRPAGMREIAVRTVLRVVDGIGGYIVGLIVMMVTGQRRQRLGDLAAGTIVVDASAPSFVARAPVVETVEVVEDEVVEDEPAVPEMRPFDPPVVEDEPVEDDPVAYEPVAPVAVEVAEDEPVAPVAVVEVAEPVEDEPVEDAPAEDYPAQDEPAEDEPVEDDPVKDEPVEDEVAEDEPVAHVAVVELAEPVEDEPVEDEPALAMVEPLEEEPLPEVSTPSLEQLARDVADLRAEPVPVVERVEDEPMTLKPVVEDEPVEDEPMTLRSVETVSAIDLVMGGASEEDEQDEQDQAPEGPAAS